MRGAGQHFPNGPDIGPVDQSDPAAGQVVNPELLLVQLAFELGRYVQGAAQCGRVGARVGAFELDEEPVSMDPR